MLNFVYIFFSCENRLQNNAFHTDNNIVMYLSFTVEERDNVDIITAYVIKIVAFYNLSLPLLTLFTELIISIYFILLICRGIKYITKF